MKPPLPHALGAVPRLPHVQLKIAKAIHNLTASCAPRLPEVDPAARICLLGCALSSDAKVLKQCLRRGTAGHAALFCIEHRTGRQR
jgi:hypothetical protein